MATETELVLGNPKQLKEYLETLPIEFQLRFPSITALKGHFAGVMVICDNRAKSKYVLMGAYNTKLSGLQKDQVEINSNDLNTDFEETPFTLIRFGVTKETGLIMGAIKLLGLPSQVRNTNPAIDAVYHEKYYAVIDKFKGKVRPPDEELNPKIKEFVWIKDTLLHRIFELPHSVKSHPQKEAYKRFMSDKKTKPIFLSLKEMLSKRKFFKN